MSEPEPGVDPDTLREVLADPSAVHARVIELRADVLAAPDAVAELLARGGLVDLLGAAGQYEQALREAQLAADRADAAGTGAQQHLARVRLAQAQQWCGRFAESNVGFTELVHAANQFGPVIAGFTHHHAGLNAYDQHDYSAAYGFFSAALGLRQEFDLPEEQIAQSRIALAAVARRTGQHAP